MKKRTKNYCKIIDDSKLLKYYVNAKANILTAYTKFLFFTCPER